MTLTSKDKIDIMKKRVARPVSEGSRSVSLDEESATTLMQRHIRNNLASSLQRSLGIKHEADSTIFSLLEG